MAKSKAHPKPDNPDQSRAFIEKAKEIGADGDASRADEVVRKLTDQKPDPKPAKKS